MKKLFVMSLIFKAEFYKNKSNFSLGSLLFLPVIITFFIFIFYVYSYRGTCNEHNHWLNYTVLVYWFYAFFYPVFISIAAFSLWNVDYYSNNLNRLKTLPVKFCDFYVAKLLLLVLYVTVSVMASYGLLIISGNIMCYVRPCFGMQFFYVRPLLDLLFIKTWIVVLFISLMQFLLSYIFRSFLIPVCIAVFFIVLNLNVSQWEYAFLIPYGNIFVLLNDFKCQRVEFFTDDIGFAFLYMFVILFGGYCCIIKDVFKR